MASSENTEQLSFAKDIQPLFRDKDRESMRFAFDLWSYKDVVANAQAILDAIRSKKMPCDGAWPDEHVERLQHWIETGVKP